MNDLYIGIDTSNYKTSVAVTDSCNRIVFENSELLEVPAGKRGLRQSEAFFMHSMRLPGYTEKLAAETDLSAVRAIGVSSRPRRVEGSYMPCFMAGLNLAKEAASLLGIPLYEFSHQEGHAAAIIEDPSFHHAEAHPVSSDALFFHLSGGTTEFLLCRMDENGYDLQIAGGTKDISIGQLIDRAGVAMGLPFPSGPFMDHTALEFKGTPSDILPRIAVKDGYFNLSGAETKLLRCIEATDQTRYPDLTAELFGKTSALLASSAKILSDRYSVSTVIMAGGVSSSSFIRDRIRDIAQSSKDIYPEIIFGDPHLSGDNAVGTARLARRIHNEK